MDHGQVCCAGSRLYVQKKMYDNVVADLASLTKTIKQGNVLLPETTMGPLVSEEQQKRVKGYIDKGSEEGAELVVGGTIPYEQGYFVAPTVFADVNHSMTIAKEEIFGPIVAAMPFDDLDDLVAKANDSLYGLATGVWTQDIKKAHYLAHRIKAGTVWVNCYNVFDAASPFVGYKQSGIGRECGSYALDNYTEVKSVWVNMN
jgi:acyl-CoA reductase-like NAD-dependent aldehyde dehydrogenase